MTSQPKIVIVILHWRGLDDTLTCLASLRSLTYANWNLILVLNGASRDDDCTLAQHAPASTLVVREKENQGFARGSNIGIEAAVSQLGADFVLLLNNDTIVDPALLTSLVGRAEADPGTAIVGARTYDLGTNRLQFTAGHVDLWRGRAYNRGNGLEDTGQFPEARETEFVQGSCFLIRSSSLSRMGLLDEAFFAYWEETDLCLRAREHGFRVMYEPDAKVWHHAGRSSPSHQRLYYLLRNNIYFMRTHARWYQWLTFLPYFVLRTTPAQSLRPFLRYPRETLGAVLSGYQDGFRLYQEIPFPHGPRRR